MIADPFALLDEVAPPNAVAARTTPFALISALALGPSA